MANITIQFNYEGKLYELEFIQFWFGDYTIYQVTHSELELFPERIRFTEILNFNEHLTLPQGSLMIDPRIRSAEARIVYFMVYSSLLQQISLPDIEITCSISSINECFEK